MSLLGLFELPWSLFRGPGSSVIQGEQDDCLQRCAGRLWPGTTYIAPGLKTQNICIFLFGHLFDGFLHKREVK